MKTIRQIAEEMGVAKNTVSNLVKELGIEPNKVGNRFEFSPEQEEKIKTAYSEERRKETRNAQKGVLTTLQEQLDRKDEQIKALHEQIKAQQEQLSKTTNALEAAQQTAQAAQALHAGTIQQQLAIESSDENAEQAIEKLRAERDKAIKERDEARQNAEDIDYMLKTYANQNEQFRQKNGRLEEALQQKDEEIAQLRGRSLWQRILNK